MFQCVAKEYVTQRKYRSVLQTLQVGCDKSILNLIYCIFRFIDGKRFKLKIIQCIRKVAVHLGYGTKIWFSVSKLPLKCAVVSLYSVVKQQLKCNTGKVCNCLSQCLLTLVLSVDFQHLL
jgi:hypothetical protein